MHPDLERLIQLQKHDLELRALHQTIDTEAERHQQIEVALDTQRSAVRHIREQVTENQNTRRAIEKELAQVQARLSRYRDQLMEVKTNKEYHAMQTEIAAAEAEVRKQEDRILECMVAADQVTAEATSAERELARAEADAKAAIEALARDTEQARQRLTAAEASRRALAATLPRATLTLFENIASHRGTAVVEARDGHCSVCHVRLRPKFYQDLRRNDAILQCESCHRILYFVPAMPQAPQSTAQ
jgi:predicted  nucleic acid-binding Zn-ribbon protein